MHLPLRWLYLDLNSYFASVEQQLQPHLRGKPVAVVPTMTDATCAIAASYEAKAMGVKTGTHIYKAKEICPELICIEARHDKYVEFHHKVKAELERHLPVAKVCSIDEFACELMENEQAPEVILRKAYEIKAGIAKNVGEFVRCSIGIATNKYLAKVGTELQKPNGLVMLEADDLPHKLYSLKIRDLPGIGWNMEKRLHMHGINDLPTLMKYSPKQMRQIWRSVWGEKMYYMLRGIDIPDLETVKSCVGHSHVMAPELRDPAKALLVAKRLTVKAASRLRRLGYYAQSLTFSASFENGFGWAMEARCIQAQDNQKFLEMLMSIWKVMLKDTNNARLKKISVTIHRLSFVETSAAQTSLFDMLDPVETKRRLRALQVSKAMDKINHRFGAG